MVIIIIINESTQRIMSTNGDILTGEILRTYNLCEVTTNVNLNIRWCPIDVEKKAINAKRA